MYFVLDQLIFMRLCSLDTRRATTLYSVLEEFINEALLLSSTLSLDMVQVALESDGVFTSSS